MPIPILETARLRMRGHQLDDFPSCAAMWADTVVTRHFGGMSFTEEESWTRFLRYLGHWEALGFGYWLVEEKETGDFVGEVGFADYKRDIQPSLKGIPEIGWVLSARTHGQGYATEAARAAITWGEGHFGKAQTACIIDPGNLPSIGVAKKCGFRELQTTVYKGRPIVVFVR